MGADEVVSKNLAATDQSIQPGERTLQTDPFHDQINQNTKLADWKRPQLTNQNLSNQPDLTIEGLGPRDPGSDGAAVIDYLPNVPKDQPKPATELAQEAREAFKNYKDNPQAFAKFNKDFAHTCSMLSEQDMRKLVADMNQQLPKGEGVMLERHPNTVEYGKSEPTHEYYSVVRPDGTVSNTPPYRAGEPSSFSTSEPSERYTVHFVSNSRPTPGMEPAYNDPDKGPLYELSNIGVSPAGASPSLSRTSKGWEYLESPSENPLTGPGVRWSEPFTTPDPGLVRRLSGPGHIEIPPEYRYTDPPGPQYIHVSPEFSDPLPIRHLQIPPEFTDPPSHEHVHIPPEFSDPLPIRHLQIPPEFTDPPSHEQIHIPPEFPEPKTSLPGLTPEQIRELRRELHLPEPRLLHPERLADPEERLLYTTDER